jgi:transposase
VFVDGLELRDLGFDGVDPAATGRPAYHPSPMLKLYIYGYLNRVQSSRRLEREASRNLEVMWLTGRLAPDHKTIADFRKDNGPAIKKVCAQFVELCRKMGLLTKASVAIDGSGTLYFVIVVDTADGLKQVLLEPPRVRGR